MLVTLPAFSAGQRGGQEKHLRADLLRAGLASLHAHALLPEIGRFGHREVAHHHPFELGQPLLDELGIDGADHRVLAEDELAFDHAMQHRQRHRQLRHVAGQLGQELVAPFVALRGGIAVPGLQQAGDVFREVVPPAGRRRFRSDILFERAVAVERVGLRQVGGQHVVQRRDVRAALDGGVAAQRHDAAAGPPDVAEQALDDGGAADDLHAVGVVRPADRIRERPGPFAARVLDDNLADASENLLRAAGDLLDHLRRVAGEVPLQDLIDAVPVLERRVLGRRALGHAVRLRALLLALHPVLGDRGRDHLALVLPRRFVVVLLLEIEAGEDSVILLRSRHTHPR